MSISALKRYQRARGTGRFADLSPDQRAVAEAHYQRLCAKWGNDLPQWRNAILVGRAKDLVLRPRDAEWGRALQKGRRRQPAAETVSPGAPPQSPPQPGVNTPPRAASPSRLIPKVTSSSDAGHVSYRIRAHRGSPRPAHVASSPPEPSTLPPPSPHAVRLDVRGLTARGTDGLDSAQRILRDVEHAFDENPHFSIAVPEKDLPPGWIWRLEVIPVS